MKFERLLARKSCPCEFSEVEPCSPDCTCRHPGKSGGCGFCCRYGSPEQQLSAAKLIVQADAELSAFRERERKTEQELPGFVLTIRHGAESWLPYLFRTVEDGGDNHVLRKLVAWVRSSSAADVARLGAIADPRVHVVSDTLTKQACAEAGIAERQPARTPEETARAASEAAQRLPWNQAAGPTGAEPEPDCKSCNNTRRAKEGWPCRACMLLRPVPPPAAYPHECAVYWQKRAERAEGIAEGAEEARRQVRVLGERTAALEVQLAEKQRRLDQIKDERGFIGPRCTRCHGKHIGASCPEVLVRDLETQLADLSNDVDLAKAALQPFVTQETLTFRALAESVARQLAERERPAGALTVTVELVSYTPNPKILSVRVNGVVFDDHPGPWKFEQQWTGSVAVPAPAAAVALLAVTGDAARAVRAWQETRTEEYVESVCGLETMLPVLFRAKVLDADALIPLLRAILEWSQTPGRDDLIIEELGVLGDGTEWRKVIDGTKE